MVDSVPQTPWTIALSNDDKNNKRPLAPEFSSRVKQDNYSNSWRNLPANKRFAKTKNREANIANLLNVADHDLLDPKDQDQFGRPQTLTTFYTFATVSNGSNMRSVWPPRAGSVWPPLDSCLCVYHFFRLLVSLKVCCVTPRKSQPQLNGLLEFADNSSKMAAICTTFPRFEQIDDNSDRRGLENGGITPRN